MQPIERGNVDKILRAKIDMAKVIRAKVRLKYALLADNEIRDVLPIAEKAFDKAVMQSKLTPGAPLSIAGVLAEIGVRLDERVNNAQ
jgi:hypothetical protein